MGARAVQSMLTPAAAEAAHIEWLWWVMLGIVTTIFVLVVGAVVGAMVRSGSGRPEGRPLQLYVATAVGATVVTLVVLLGASVLTGRALQAPADGRDLVTLRITGYQWWWDVEYEAGSPAGRVRTSNDIHLPVGRTARILLDSGDVIHSFSAPNFTGKMDLVPGHRNVVHVTPARTGEFRAQCAEFCGLQHAHMALDITVDTPEAFAAWLDRMRTTPPAPSPADAEAVRGREIVERGSCALCHRVAGTTAGARTAPDLSHVASRRTIGAGTLPNDEASLAAWIDNPQQFKPGSRMPPSGLSPADRDAVVAYLRTLR